MAQCLRITFTFVEIPKNFLHNVVQKHARTLELEGTGQLIENEVKIMVCGTKQALDAFIDELHKELAKKSIEELVVEPFLKDKDYRNVFRIIE